MRKKAPAHPPKQLATKLAARPAGPYPPAFVDFMMRHWRRPPGRPPARVKGLAYFARRRQALRQLFPQDVLIVPTGHEKCRANDTFYRFRPGTDFFYLTGNMEPDCVLVLGPAARLGGCEEILFVEENPGRSDPSFFTDRNKGELWVGPRLGVEASLQRYGVAACRPLATWPDFLAELAGRGGAKKKTGTKGQRGGLRFVPAMSPAVDRACGPEPVQADPASGQPQLGAGLAAALSEMRLIKDAHEVRSLERACASSVRGFEDVARQLVAAHSERQVEGIFNLRARTEGYDVGYNTIAAAGHTRLHPALDPQRRSAEAWPAVAAGRRRRGARPLHRRHHPHLAHRRALLRQPAAGLRAGGGRPARGSDGGGAGGRLHGAQPRRHGGLDPWPHRLGHSDL